jgi:hypothetical protein
MIMNKPHFFLLPTKDYEASLASLIFLPPSAAVASDGTPQPDQKNRLSIQVTQVVAVQIQITIIVATTMTRCPNFLNMP